MYPVASRPNLAKSDSELDRLLHADELFYSKSLDLVAGLALPTAATVEAMHLAPDESCHRRIPGQAVYRNRRIHR